MIHKLTIRDYLVSINLERNVNQPWSYFVQNVNTSNEGRQVLPKKPQKCVPFHPNILILVELDTFQSFWGIFLVETRQPFHQWELSKFVVNIFHH